MKPTLLLLKIILITWHGTRATKLRPSPSIADKLKMTHDFVKRTHNDIGGKEKAVVETQDCVQMINAPSDWRYISPGSSETCGLFIVGRPNQIVSITVVEFDIDCLEEGFLTVVDGWDIGGHLFPSQLDYHQQQQQLRPDVGIAERYETYCGRHQRPNQQLIASQNVAMLQFRLPHQGQWLRVLVDFLPNPTPCNIVSTTEEGFEMLANFGHRRNCSLLIAYPVKVDLVQLAVGRRPQSSEESSEVARRVKNLRPQNRCHIRPRDFVEVLGGSAIDTSAMSVHLKICQPTDITMTSTVNAPYTAIRLVSSGHYDNAVTFHYEAVESPDYTY